MYIYKVHFKCHNKNQQHTENSTYFPKMLIFKTCEIMKCWHPLPFYSTHPNCIPMLAIYLKKNDIPTFVIGTNQISYIYTSQNVYYKGVFFRLCNEKYISCR